MGVIFLVVFFFVSFLIVGLVLLQEGKGGGLTGMSTGMDGVMGAKNPLRRWTTYFFIVFVFMCLAINMYFHNREDTSLPSGLSINRAESAIEEVARQEVPEGSLRPAAETTEALALPETTVTSETPEAATEAVETPAAAAASEATDSAAASEATDSAAASEATDSAAEATETAVPSEE